MTREELIQKGASAIRTNSHLFNIYKRYFEEDFNALPEGCFSCGFNNYFRQWVDKVQKKTNTNISYMNATNSKNNKFILKDNSTLRYLNGKVYSKYSTDEDWKEYLAKKPNEITLFNYIPKEENTELEKTNFENSNDVLPKKRGRKAK